MSADPPELSRFRQRLPETSAGVTVLSETSQPFVEVWYDLSSEDHFWFQWRLAATLRLLADHGIPTDRDWKAFEVGCGNGVLLTQIERATHWSVDGADLDRGALARIPPGRGRRFAYDVLERRPEFREVYDVVILYDVIEHVEDTAPFLRACLDPLRPGGLLLVNVPALPWLWSRYDVAAGHRRRYDRSSLPAELAGLGVSVLETRCWGLSMIPVLALRKLLARFAGDPTGVIDAGFRPPGALVHALLRGLARAETALLPRPPSGTSLLLLARKQA